MAFTYRKEVDVLAYSDGVSKKIVFDFEKTIASDVNARSKIADVAIKEILFVHMIPTGEQIRTDPIISKISVHGALVEIEFGSSIPISSLLWGIVGEDTYSPLFCRLYLIFDLV